MPAEEFTLGVEEEYQIIDPETRGLSPAGEAVLERAQRTLGEQAEGGNGARRQRRAYARAGRLEDVVDMLVEETAQGTSPA